MSPFDPSGLALHPPAVSGPGQFKTASMNACIDALGAVVTLLSDLKTSLGGSVAVHEWVDHIDVSG